MDSYGNVDTEEIVERLKKITEKIRKLKEELRKHEEKFPDTYSS